MDHRESLEKRRKELTAKLRELDGLFEREMRVRGFEPSQAENVALTAKLARLYAAREELRAEIENLSPQLELKGPNAT
jgi:hypothetical protein